MNLDIETTVRTLFFLLLLASAILITRAVRSFREANRLNFFLKKRELLGRAWKTVFYALGVIGLAFFINTFAEPATYRVFSPSPTATPVPSATLSPTASITSTATLLPTETVTPEFTATPIMPVVISQEFTSQVTPNPDAVFSPIVFSRQMTDDYQPIDPSNRFENPVEVIYGTYSYDRMTPRAQWTSLWFREGELICYETIPWNGGVGGFGYTDCTLPADQWLPGNYQVQMFVGDVWKISGNFTITGDAPTPTPTATPSPTVTAPVQTPTPTPTATPSPTAAASVRTPTPTFTPTAIASPTLRPLFTPSPTWTPQPTLTPTNTLVPSPTIVPTATRRSTFFR